MLYNLVVSTWSMSMFRRMKTSHRDTADAPQNEYCHPPRNNLRRNTFVYVQCVMHFVKKNIKKIRYNTNTLLPRTLALFPGLLLQLVVRLLAAGGAAAVPLLLPLGPGRRRRRGRPSVGAGGQFLGDEVPEALQVLLGGEEKNWGVTKLGCVCVCVCDKCGKRLASCS